MIHFKNILTLNLKDEFQNNIDKSSAKTPRKHQLAAHKALTNFFIQKNKKKGLLVLPTGGGKTYATVYWLCKNVLSKNKKILWLADQGFLLEQARETFKESILEIDRTKRELVNIRIVSGSDRHSNPNQILISDDILLITAQTAISNWDVDENTNFKTFIKHHGVNDDLFVVYDEAHHTPAFGRRNLLIGGSKGKTGITEKFPNAAVLGLTATPTYTNKNQRGWLWDIFCDGIIYEIAKKELEDAKILAHPIFIQQKTNFNLVLSDSDVEKLVFKHQEIPAHLIETLAKDEERNHFIAQYYCNNIEKFGKTIIFLDRWYQCRTIENYINKAAGKTIAASMFSYVDTNKNTNYINTRTANWNEINLEKFKEKNGALQVLLNVKMLTEGVDIPDVKTVFITRDTNSTILFTQMIGRALRGENAGGNKETANIVLFTDNWNRHVSFASNRLLGGKETTTTKERGLRPYELIRIDLLDKLEFEYQNQNYDTSIENLLPMGWFVVCYTDCFSEEMESGEFQKSIENFTENVIILEHEKQIVDNYIAYFTDYKHIMWEHEEIDSEKAEELIRIYLEDNNFKPNKVLISKLIQIARHLGQNNTEPEYFTFEQKNDINVKKYVLEIRQKNYGRDETEIYLENLYLSASNPFLKVLFPVYEDFYRAYEYEDNVYRKQRKGIVKISEGSQKIKVQRLASEDIKKIVHSRDGHKCLCCGKTNRLQTDHIIAFKTVEPDDDDPELYQSLCSICNREKSSNSCNYRITNYDNNKMSLQNVQTTDGEDASHYFIRLINCYYKTDAVHKSEVKTLHNGHAIWKAKIKLGTIPDENILLEKEALMSIIKSKGYKLRDIQIVAY
jgi:superfamily II DNA or RNA helicase